MAPITTYWFFVLSYGVFLANFTYVCLVKTPSEMTLPEIYLASYVLTFGFNIIAKVPLPIPAATPPSPPMM